jgi:hypothetical protein
VIENYPFYPPEAVYQRKAPSERPALVTRTVGSSRLAYMAGDVDASFWRFDNPDLGRLIGNTVRWLLAGQVSVSVAGDGLMEVLAWQTRAGFAVHMLNYNGPNAFRGHMRSPLDLGEQKVRIVLPEGAAPSNARLLWANAPVPFVRSGNAVELTVPKVGPYEVLAIT